MFGQAYAMKKMSKLVILTVFLRLLIGKEISFMETTQSNLPVSIDLYLGLGTVVQQCYTNTAMFGIHSIVFTTDSCFYCTTILVLFRC